MRHRSLMRAAIAVLIAPFLLALALPGNAPPVRKAYALSNGLWFDGEKFVAKRLYTVNGVFTSKKPAGRLDAIDLSGRYVVPPFGEAHNHNLAQSPRLDAVIRMYLDAGIFYVKNPNSLPSATRPLAGKINTPGSVDAIFSGGGLTASGGHPIGLVAKNIARGAWTAADGEGAFYFVIDDRADLERKWNAILAGRPDFIKTYLMYSEDYPKRKTGKEYFDWRGLDPAILPEIVRRAHGAGLRVSTHVETAADFHHAVGAGVDEINHLPGFRPEKDDPSNYRNLSRYEIADSDARLAARNRIVVVTTVGELLDELDKIDEGSPQAPVARAVRDMVARNLKLLATHHVTIAIGSDQYSQTSLAEAMSLHRLGVFDNLALLKAWCEATPGAIFPGRKIGRLAEGYEASFLALNGDPLRDFTNVRRIGLRMKQGELLSSAD